MDEKKISIEDTTIVLVKFNNHGEFDGIWFDEVEKLIDFENYMNSILDPEDGYFALINARKVPGLNNKSI